MPGQPQLFENQAFQNIKGRKDNRVSKNQEAAGPKGDCFGGGSKAQKVAGGPIAFFAQRKRKRKAPSSRPPFKRILPNARQRASQTGLALKYSKKYDVSLAAKKKTLYWKGRGVG